MGVHKLSPSLGAAKITIQAQLPFVSRTSCQLTGDPSSDTGASTIVRQDCRI